MIKNLSQMKKWAQEGNEIVIVENALKPRHNNQKRVIKKTQTNAWKTVRQDGSVSWLYFQKARNMRFNNDNTVDFLVGEEMKDRWLIEELLKEGKDYWLKVELVEQ